MTRIPRLNVEIDQSFYCAFKKVRNFFRKFEPLSVVLQTLSYINSKPTALAASHQPWMLLLLIKWVMQDEQVFQRGRKQIDQSSLVKLINLTYQVGDQGRLPSETEGLDIFFRRMAYQQFIFQNQTHGVLSSFALDVELFGSSNNQSFSEKFYSQYSLSVEDFLVLAFTIVASQVSGECKSFYKVSYFNQISHKFEENVILSFLDAISIPVNKLPEVFKKPQKERMTADELYETSPFFTFPLIKFDDRYFVTHPEVIVRALKEFLYRNYKVLMNDKQKRRFGYLFEKRLGKMVDHLGSKVVTEDTLKEKIGDQGKVVDFFIKDPLRPIFVEAKATELSKGGKLAISSMKLKDRMKQVLDAIVQAEETFVRIKSSGFESFVGKIPFLIVVTYGPFFIGDGKHLGRLFEDTSFEPPVNIPIDNIFVLSFSEFEYLSKISKVTQNSFGEILNKVQKTANQPSDRKFIFQSYLDEIYQGVQLLEAPDDPFTVLLESTLSY